MIQNGSMVTLEYVLFAYYNCSFFCCYNHIKYTDINMNHKL